MVDRNKNGAHICFGPYLEVIPVVQGRFTARYKLIVVPMTLTAFEWLPMPTFVSYTESNPILICDLFNQV